MIELDGIQSMWPIFVLDILWDSPRVFVNILGQTWIQNIYSMQVTDDHASFTNPKDEDKFIHCPAVDDSGPVRRDVNGRNTARFARTLANTLHLSSIPQLILQSSGSRSGPHVLVLETPK
jgi:hypothetical protein